MNKYYKVYTEREYDRLRNIYPGLDVGGWLRGGMQVRVRVDNIKQSGYVARTSNTYYQREGVVILPVPSFKNYYNRVTNE